MRRLTLIGLVTMLLFLAACSLLFLVACSQITIDNTSGGGTGGSGGSGGSGGTGGSPTSPTPTPSTGGNRAPDPPSGAILALPSNAQGIAATYASNNATLLSTSSCPTTNPTGGWAYLDGLVRALRASDTRWGYLQKPGGSVALDIVAYHATAGPDVTGATGVYIVDVINSVCAVLPATPGAQWFVSAYDPAGIWSTRGQF
jgi:hypothetical protein